MTRVTDEKMWWEWQFWKRELCNKL